MISMAPHALLRANLGLGDWWVMEIKHCTYPSDHHCICTNLHCLFTTGLTSISASPPPPKSGHNPGCWATRLATPSEGGFGGSSVSICARKWNGVSLLLLDFHFHLLQAWNIETYQSPGVRMPQAIRLKKGIVKSLSTILTQTYPGTNQLKITPHKWFHIPKFSREICVLYTA